VIYLDTSAFLKSVWEESESAALLSAIADQPTISSALLAVEARRSTVRVDAALLPRTDLLLGEVTQIDVSPAVLESASRMPDPQLRTLDAIHLATALLVREELDLLLSYDQRLLDAAQEYGIPTAAPV
jgi:uncharacterized protein